jgi:ABC-type transporter Mla MlaB component
MKALAKAQEASALAVDEAVTRYAISADRVADEMARLAFTRLDQVASVRTEVGADGKRRQVVMVRDFSDVDAQALSALVKVKRSASGEVSVELADKLAALNSLARLKGWIADKPSTPGNLVMLRVER